MTPEETPAEAPAPAPQKPQEEDSDGRLTSRRRRTPGTRRTRRPRLLVKSSTLTYSSATFRGGTMT